MFSDIYDDVCDDDCLLVHVDMEDEAFLEIAELLDTQQGDKFAFMLLRSGEDLEHASIVQVQMVDEEDSVEAVR